MLDIAKRAKASKETIYAWFGNKEKLFETILHEHYYNVLAEAVPASTELNDPRVFLNFVAHALLNLVNAPRINRLIIVTLAEGAKLEAGVRIVVERSAVGRADLIGHFERFRAAGLMEFEQDADQIASMFVAMALGEWRDRLNLGLIQRVTPAEIEAHAKLATDMFLKAVAPRGRLKK